VQGAPKPARFRKASAYLPALELLYRYFGIEDADDKATQARIEMRLSALDPVLKMRSPCLYPDGTALGAELGRDGPADKRRRMLDAIKRIASSCAKA
jgi:hypothetical protein